MAKKKEIVHSQDTLRELDQKTLLMVKRELLAEENSLYAGKWWDYKPLHPLEATYQFTDAYVWSAKNAIRKHKDIWKGIFGSPLKNPDFLLCSQSTITGLWKARQMADRIGCPYDFYCSEVMRFAEARKFRFIPLPTQCYRQKPFDRNDISMVEHISLAWEKAQHNRIFHAQSRYFSIDAFKANRYWIEHQRYLLEIVRARKGLQHILVAELVFEKRLLDPQVVIKGIESGEKLLNEARYYLES